MKRYSGITKIVLTILFVGLGAEMLGREIWFGFGFIAGAIGVFAWAISDEVNRY